MTRHGPLKRILRSVGIATLAVSALVVVGPAVAAASTSATSVRPHIAGPVLELGDAATTVKTSNGTSFSLVVGWSDLVVLGGTATLDVGLQRLVKSGGTGYELHLWTFAVAKSTLSFNDKTGTLKASASPVASVNLSFKTTSSKKATCSSGKETIYSGTLSGSVMLVTGLSGGGTVKSSSFHFTTAKPEITVDSGCIEPIADTCASELAASSGNFTTGVSAFAGSFSLVSPTFNVVGLERITKLSSPAGATRTDIAAMIDKAGKVFATYGASKVKMASSGFVSGSATLSGGRAATIPSKCTYKGKKYDLTSVLDEDANYTGTMSANNAIGGVMKAPASTKTGFYDVTTSKPA